jgi:hypothetical protein
VTRAARLDERTATKVAPARTSVPAAVASEAAIAQLSMGRFYGASSTGTRDQWTPSGPRYAPSEQFGVLGKLPRWSTVACSSGTG